MRKKICFVVAVPGTAQAFLRDHIKSLSEKYDVYLVCNIKSEEEISSLSIKGCYSIDIQRKIAVFKDAKALWKLYQYFKKMKFDAVHALTLKPGLLNAIAAKMAHVENRINVFTGQYWATKKGFARFFFKSIDKLIARLDNYILVDGKSQREFIISEGIVSEEKSMVFGKGSICGVNINRFTPSATTRKNIRKELGLNDNQVVFVFLGRMNRDKGVGELLLAFNKLAGDYKDAFLLLIGDNENGFLEKNMPTTNIHDGINYMYYGYTKNPEVLLQAGDVFCLPTYREGFGMSALEASCLGLPVICSDVYGVRDTMIDDVTGLRCKVRNVDSLYSCMKDLYINPSKREFLGKNGREMVLRDFQGATLTKCWVDFYDTILKGK